MMMMQQLVHRSCTLLLALHPFLMLLCVFWCLLGCWWWFLSSEAKLIQPKLKFCRFCALCLVCVCSVVPTRPPRLLQKDLLLLQKLRYSRAQCQLCVIHPTRKKEREEKKSTKQQFNNFNNSQYQLTEKLLLPVMQFIWFTKSHFALTFTFTLCLTFPTNWRKWESRLVALG